MYRPQESDLFPTDKRCAQIRPGAMKIKFADVEFMSSEIMHQIIQTIEDEVNSRPSPNRVRNGLPSARGYRSHQVRHQAYRAVLSAVGPSAGGRNCSCLTLFKGLKPLIADSRSARESAQDHVVPEQSEALETETGQGKRCFHEPANGSGPRTGGYSSQPESSSILLHALNRDHCKGSLPPRGKRRSRLHSRTPARTACPEDSTCNAGGARPPCPKIRAARQPRYR